MDPSVMVGLGVGAAAPDKRQASIDQTKAAYEEAKARLGVDHPDVKQASSDMFKLVLAHAQAIAVGR